MIINFALRLLPTWRSAPKSAQRVDHNFFLAFQAGADTPHPPQLLHEVTK